MRFIINIFIAFFVSFVAMAQGQPSPQIQFESSVYNFGAIKEVDGEATAVFKFKNTSSTPYIIKYVSVSCGCTKAEYKRAPIMPNEMSELKVRYNPEGRSGTFSSKLYVVDGAGKYANELEIKGVIEPRPKTVEDLYPVELSDGIRVEALLATYKEVPVGYAHNLMIGVYNSSNKDVDLKTTVDAKGGRFKAYMSPATLKPQEKGQLFVIYDLKTEPKLYGNFETEVNIDINGVRSKEKFVINGISIPDFTSYTPDMIQNSPVGELSSRFYHFGNVKNTANLTRTFTLENKGKNDLEILEVSKSSDKISCSMPKKIIKSGDKISITTNLIPVKTDKGRIAENIIIVTNDQSQPLKEMRLVANIE
ncbi:MAG: DUF1573 domain-containing protein [Rikenellaceae bacterium]